MNLPKLSNQVLHQKTCRVARIEQKASLALLTYLHEIRKRRVYAELGYSSLWEYVVKALGYDPSQASQRIRAMELVVSEPEARKQMQSGQLCIAKAAAIQTFVKNTDVSKPEKKDLLLQLKDSSVRETRKALEKLGEETVKGPSLPLERGTCFGFEADAELVQMFERFKELKGNLPTPEMLKVVFRAYLKQTDPLQKESSLKAPELDVAADAALAKGEVNMFAFNVKTKNANENKVMQERFEFAVTATNPASGRYIQLDIRRAIAERAQGRCEWVSPINSRRCESRYRLQYDHRVPHKLGGTSEIENIQLICAVHNGFRTRHLCAELTGAG